MTKFINKTFPEWTTSAFLGGFCILLLAFQGFASQVFVEMFQDFVPVLPWPQRLLTFIHWQWTVQTGALISVLLIWKAKHLPVRLNRKIDLLVLLLLLAQAGIGIWITFFVRITAGGITGG